MRADFVALLIAAFLFSTTRAVAQGPITRVPPVTPVDTLPRGAEFTLSRFPGEVLLPVHVLGAVARPGLYHVPVQTTLLELLTHVGGLLPNADTDAVTIKRTIDQQNKVIPVDVERLLSSIGAENPVLVAGDVLYVRPDDPLISPETSSVLAFVMTILSLITTTILLEERLSRDDK